MALPNSVSDPVPVSQDPNIPSPNIVTVNIDIGDMPIGPEVEENETQEASIENIGNSETQQESTSTRPESQETQVDESDDATNSSYNQQHSCNNYNLPTLLLLPLL